MIDEENPEWTENDFKRAKRFHELPADLQAKLLAIRHAQIVPTYEPMIEPTTHTP